VVFAIPASGPFNAHGFYDAPGGHAVFPTYRDRLAYARRLAATQFGADDSRTTMGVALSELGIVDWADARAEIEAGRENGHYTSIHNAGVIYRDGVAWFVERGLLGPDILHVHTNRFSGRDLKTVRDAGGAISVTPETELQMGMGFPTTHRCRAQGVRTGLGVDIVSDMLRRSADADLPRPANRPHFREPARDLGGTVESVGMSCTDPRGSPCSTAQNASASTIARDRWKLGSRPTSS